MTAMLTALTAHALCCAGAVPQLPRRLEVYYNASVVLSSLHSVVVVVTNTGDRAPALSSIDLIMDDTRFLRVYTGSPAAPPPACPALNVYDVPAPLLTGPRAAQRVIGVRIMPNQARQLRKNNMLHVSAGGMRRQHMHA